MLRAQNKLQNLPWGIYRIYPWGSVWQRWVSRGSSSSCRLMSDRHFLYSCSISIENLFSCWISLHCHPVDLLHCSPAQQLQLLPSPPHLPSPTQHHQSITQRSPLGSLQEYMAHLASLFSSSKEIYWMTVFFYLT